MRFLVILAASLLFWPLQVSAQGTWDNSRLDRLTSPELRPFESDREYRGWIRDLRRTQRQIRERQQASLEPEVIVASARVERQQECNPLYENCPSEEDGGGTIIVTGSRVASSPQSSTVAITSITNNQSVGVDEGDIVKRIGDYLLVLQDGRIFVANFRTMQLTDRIDVYRTDEDGDPIGADWYDEMLVQGDHIIITAYSYYDDASEISVFRLDQASGTVERRGVFLLSSEDYYDVDNYATRVIGDRLVIYTPYEADELVNRRNRPVVRRWVPSQEYDENDAEPVLNAEDIYWPVFGVYEPYVHTISICDLGELDDDELDCESTGFIAGEYAEMFVSPDNIFLATTAASGADYSVYRICRAREAGFASVTEAAPGAVYRIPLRERAEVDLLPVRGVVFDQFSMDQQGSRFRMVEHWPTVECGENWWQSQQNRGQIELIDSSIGSFTAEYRTARDRDFDDLPDPGEGHVENRFIGEWLLFGTRSRYGRPPEEGDVPKDAALYAVPLANVEGATALPLGHEITRIESLGIDAIVTGYRDDTGLNISYIDLADQASIADNIFLPQRYESESRSHAFNATVYPDMDGLMGLPTVRVEEDSGRRWWRSDNSAISFLRFSADGQLTDLSDVAPGEGSDEAGDGYTCDVSCIDWYGNARPIFIERGVYALMGTELVEARALEDRVQVLRRLDLTGQVAR